MSAANDSAVWYLDFNGQPQGPYTVEQVRQALRQGRADGQTLSYGPGMTQWQPLALNPLFADETGGPPPPPPKSTFHKRQLAHEIDFDIQGNEMQFVEIELDPGEAAIAEAGAMMYMSQAIQMETVFGDGNEKPGLVGKLVGAGKRLLTGESLFMTVFTNNGQGKQHVAFAAPYPGKIIPMNLAELGGQIICQKDAFLCAAKGVAVDIAWQKKIGVALFGQEGFIMQRLSGDGLVFVHAGGTIVNRHLQAKESIKIDTGCLVALEPSVGYDIQYVGSVKSAVFGGESFFFAQLTGPGNIWLQSMPFSRLAGRIGQAGGKGEGSVLGGISRLFED